MKKLIKKKKCLVEDCPGVARTRGLCSACHQFAWSMVVDGKTTWALLENQGKCLPRNFRFENLEAREKWFGKKNKWTQRYDKKFNHARKNA